MKKMVKQDKQPKNSSRKLGSVHQFSGSIVCGYHLPLETRIGFDDDSEDFDFKDHYVISGTPDSKRFSGEGTWLDPPHIAFANLRVEDAKAAEAFIRKYGVLMETILEKDAEEEEAEAFLKRFGPLLEVSPPKGFSIDSVLLGQTQEQLRGAWDNDWKLHKAYIRLLQDQMEFGTRVNVDQSATVVLKTVDPWTYICFLFVRDFIAGKLGFCGNPECPAPYFVKKRRTQKYCEQGPCVQYAQRQYSLNWWNRGGKKRREEKRRQKETSQRKRKSEVQ